MRKVNLKRQVISGLDIPIKNNPQYSRKENCWDNAVAESFFKSLKTDPSGSEQVKQLIYGDKLISKEQMKLEIFEYIEIWCN